MTVRATATSDARVIPPGNPQRLVGVVAAYGGSASLDQISEAVWPGDPVEASRARLRNVLMRLRRVGGDLLVRSGVGRALRAGRALRPPGVRAPGRRRHRVGAGRPRAGRPAGHRGAAAGRRHRVRRLRVRGVGRSRPVASVEQQLISLLDLLSVQAEDAGDFAGRAGLRRAGPAPRPLLRLPLRPAVRAAGDAGPGGGGDRGARRRRRGRARARRWRALEPASTPHGARAPRPPSVEPPRPPVSRVRQRNRGPSASRNRSRPRSSERRPGPAGTVARRTRGSGSACRRAWWHGVPIASHAVRDAAARTCDRRRRRCRSSWRPNPTSSNERRRRRARAPSRAPPARRPSRACAPAAARSSPCATGGSSARVSCMIAQLVDGTRLVGRRRPGRHVVVDPGRRGLV